MILPVHDRIRSRIREALHQAFGLAPADQPAIVIEMPPNRTLGDLGVPVAFELARRLKKAPRQIASELAERLGTIDGIARVAPAPNGYLNFFLDRAGFLQARLGEARDRQAPATAPKVIVEHTAINPNKAAHIGHLRNATLGDTLVRALRFLGHPVEVQNYIDDTGVQVADVVVGFTALEGLGLAEVRALARRPDVRFDYYCWDLYARVTEWYEADKTRLEKRAEALHAIEEAGTPLAEMGAFVADWIVRSHLRTMARINVDYDLLTWEGDILRLHFWTTAFEQLKERRAVFLQTEGRLKGCWVMPIEDADAQKRADGDAADAPTETPPSEDDVNADTEQREKVIVRSNGTVTYVGKDIANQFWKFGLLGRDFHYRIFEPRHGNPLWATTSDAGEPQHPEFGRAMAVYNVIDSRQAYLQQLLKQALATMGFRDEADRSTHYSYEMVALTHSTARTLGYLDTESDGKPFVEVSGRKGLGVKADDLLDRLVETAYGEVTSRNPELQDDDRRRIAQTIAVAALRYFLVKFSRGKVIAFDIDGGVELRGRDRSVSAVCSRARQQHLRQAGRARRRGRGQGRRAARRPRSRCARHRRRRGRALEPRARGGAARRNGRGRGAIARAVGAGEIRVRAGAGVQRVLSPAADSSRGTAGGQALARRGRGVSPQTTHTCARSHGLRRAGAHVSTPVVAVAWPKPDYVAALERAGAVVRVLDPATDEPRAVLGSCDGLLLTGGVDVDPAEYGERERHPTVEVDATRDTYELALAREALQRDVPVLAICRGVQVLNVAAGGTLIQDLPSALPHTLQHTIEQPKDAIAHEVTVAPDTTLGRLLHVDATSRREVAVNSRHHQSVKQPAPGFVVSASAPDGVIEAIEKPHAAFCVGVQWHPENFWRTGEFAGLFAGLVEAARREK